MVTPLEIRNRRREAQRCIRLAVNVMNTFLDDWKKHNSVGKDVCVRLTNNMIIQSTIPTMELYAIDSIPCLRSALQGQLYQEQNQLIAQLQGSFKQLEDTVHILLVALDDLNELLDRSNQKPENGPVFHSLSLSDIVSCFHDITAMYTEELNIKKLIVDDFINCSQKKKNKEHMHVLITAWMLCAEIDENRVRSHMGTISEDMSGF